MTPRARSKFATPTFNLRYFGTKCTALRKLRDIVRSFRRLPQAFGAPSSDLAPGELRPPRYALAHIVYMLEVIEASRGVVGRERMGMAFPHLFHVLL